MAFVLTSGCLQGNVEPAVGARAFVAALNGRQERILFVMAWFDLVILTGLLGILVLGLPGRSFFCRRLFGLIAALHAPLQRSE